jgi:hypothetical protein
MTAVTFLPGGFPESAPRLPRRRLVALLAGAALAAGGGAALYLPRKPAPVQRPGPRRYPAAYRPGI